MKIFQEKQFLNRWWLFMFILAIIVIVVGTAYYTTLDADENTELIVSLISVAIATPIVLGLLFVRLETRIDKDGITAYFKPFSFTKKHYSWSEVSDCYLREFDSVKEYGGWGLRGLGTNKKAYHVYGNKGIQLKTKSGEDFLIGTQRPEAAKEIIAEYYRSNPNTSHEN